MYKVAMTEALHCKRTPGFRNHWTVDDVLGVFQMWNKEALSSG